MSELTAIASAIILAKGVDHCRAGDEAHRIPLKTVKREQPVASGLEFAIMFVPALMIMSNSR